MSLTTRARTGEVVTAERCQPLHLHKITPHYHQILAQGLGLRTEGAVHTVRVQDMLDSTHLYANINEQLETTSSNLADP
jgi:hypothetical protein